MKELQRCDTERPEKSARLMTAAGFILAMVFSVSVATAQISVTDADQGISENDDAPTVCPTAKRPLDYDGDLKTDFTVVRNTGGGSGGAITWFINNSNNSSLTASPWGISTDRFVSGDFDGDNRSDITVWRPGAQAYYYILQSGSNTLRSVPFGQTNDNPTVVGDYTGDGKADPAVYRSGALSGQQSYWYYLASSGPNVGNLVSIQWGQNGDFPAPGDYDGDGKYDVAVQRGSGGSATFYINQTTAGFVAIPWGLSSDSVIPGDYDGDCKTDIAVSRSVGGTINWYIRRSASGAIFVRQFGAAATDFLTQGDYDGDGTTDIAVWRISTGSFYFLRSLDGTFGGSAWGQNGDYPLANFNTH